MNGLASSYAILLPRYSVATHSIKQHTNNCLKVIFIIVESPLALSYSEEDMCKYISTILTTAARVGETIFPVNCSFHMKLVPSVSQEMIGIAQR